MKGHIRKRGNSFAVYLSAQELAQRCTKDRSHLHWVDKGALDRCRECGSPMKPPSMERRQHVSTLATVEEAEKARRDGTTALDQGREPFQRVPRVHEFITRWLEHKEQKRLRPTTMAGYRRLINKYVLPEIGARRLNQVRVADIQKMLDLAAVTDAARTVQQLRAVTSSMFSSAVRWELISHNPVRGAETQKAERPALEVPTPEQVTALIGAARETPWAMPILLSSTLGTRRSETLAISWSAVDLERGRVSITRNLQRVPGKGLTFFPPKSQKSRRLIVIPEFVVPILRAWRKTQTERRLQAGPAWEDFDLVCDRGDGKPFDPDAFSHACKRLMKVAGLDPATRLHDCRHAYATTLLEQGVDTAIVSSVLGHATTWFTADTYQHVREGMVEQAAAAIDRALRG